MNSILNMYEVDQLLGQSSDVSSPAMMEPIDPASLIMGQDKLLDDELDDRLLANLPDVALTTEFTSLKLEIPEMSESLVKSFLLLDGKELLKVSSADDFIKKLNIQDSSVRIKVISIFGNTGDGKSHTLNRTFFDGQEVFQTSNEQNSCTLGVWAAYDPDLKLICLDTEGLLGTTSHENQRTRLLLKILAISDIVIYRTRSERLHRDLFSFLGSASRTYTQHFHSALQSVTQRNEFGGPLSALGPAVIIFHETRHTQPLHPVNGESTEDLIRSSFARMKLDIDAFSSLRYIGIQTQIPPTSFSELRDAVTQELNNTTVRSARSPQIVFVTLNVLNDKFSGELEDKNQLYFPDQYFTCSATCLSCEKRCERSMGHVKEGVSHHCSCKCRYQHQYDNCVYVCKACHTNGQEVVVKPKYVSSSDSSWFAFAKYAWSGYVIECPFCGEIYRSRQFWYGNNEPDAVAVRTEIMHVWSQGNSENGTVQNPAQRVLDSVSYLSEAVASVTSEPSRVASSWIADQIAPKYWKPNSEIKNCKVCLKLFPNNASKHHCRACGDGVCEGCSMNNKPVPEKGWESPVRVCDICYKGLSKIAESYESSDHNSDDNEVIVRKVGEAVVSTISSVVSVLEYPKSFIKDSARPAYWVPDHEIKKCNVCQCDLRPPKGAPLHHCRDCGNGVCPSCSMARIPVPKRGWNHPVRVCNNCVKS
ncbi:unnamed protein product [Bemisia tabaci]|uniref:FYVE-type domain-containing protein n=1 Tax=Bemisia tabaci TaxID=7038 RepID=A0A9P0AH75_BEMTA|nr:unnamed protein product [Bemisia tabaci]